MRANTFRFFVATLLVVVLPASICASESNAFSVTYDGGSVSDAKAGGGLKLHIESNQIRFVKDKRDVLIIPATAVTEMSYGQDVHRRVGTAIGLAVFSLGIGALMLLSKCKKHFVGLTWADGDKKGGLAIQCDENNYRGMRAWKESPARRRSIQAPSW